MHPVLTRTEAEDFLFAETALLDAWQLNEWLALFTNDAIYEVPPAGTGDDARSDSCLFYVADDRFRLGHRVQRLMSPEAHSEQPRSVCVRMVGNVRVMPGDDATAVVHCSFVTWRSKHDMTDVYPGHHRYVLRRDDDGALRIAAKRSTLALNNLRPQGRVSIIL
jgi:p-cumate 2,3-dioxygenase subunit beta